ncbi:hypothetical protein BH09PSE2_BH09PSE2_05260 [soil metagenome]
MLLQTPSPITAPAEVIRRYPDAHATHGAAVDARFVYAVSNSKVTKLDKATGAKVGEWLGDPSRFPHINSCAVIAGDLVCASSNCPATPMRSAVVTLDPVAMTLKAERVLPGAPGSVTWIDRRGSVWWVGFANYDGKGGEPGRDHTASAVVSYDAKWRMKATWRFPEVVLERFAPHSSSGGGWGPDGRLYITGHDLPELYALRLPRKGDRLEFVATVPVAVEGQAVAWDRTAACDLYGVSRKTGEIVAMRVPPVSPPS